MSTLFSLYDGFCGLFVPIHHSDDIFVCFPFSVLLSDILEVMRISAYFILYKLTPRWYILSIRSIEHFQGGNGAEKDSLNPTRF